MTTEIDIKALAEEIARHHGVTEICGRCEDLIGESDPDLSEYVQIEDAAEDGFLGFDEWIFDIRFTPAVKTYSKGGFEGCDWSDCDHVVDEITGVDFIDVYGVHFLDGEGNEYELTANQRGQLEKELMDAIYEY